MASIENLIRPTCFLIIALTKKQKQAIKTNQSASVVGLRNVADVVNYVWMCLEQGQSWGPSVQVSELGLTKPGRVRPSVRYIDFIV